MIIKIIFYRMKKMKKILAFCAAMFISTLPLKSEEIGVASYYWQGQKTANGERYNPYAYTAAHKRHPFNSVILVTNLKNGKSVTLRVNDRGPFIKGRIVDVSKRAAIDLGMIKSGITKVKVVRIK